jgi:hypothetical protein
MTLRVRGGAGAGLEDIVGSELASLDAAAQHEQSGVLAGVERVGDVGGRFPRAEAVRLVVIASAAAVEAFGVELLWLGDHWCSYLRFPRPYFSNRLII